MERLPPQAIRPRARVLEDNQGGWPYEVADRIGPLNVCASRRRNGMAPGDEGEDASSVGLKGWTNATGEGCPVSSGFEGMVSSP